MSEHTSEVSYTNSDDGIWITCTTCKATNPTTDEELVPGRPWNVSALMYWPSVEEITAMWERHLKGEW